MASWVFTLKQGEGTPREWPVELYATAEEAIQALLRALLDDDADKVSLTVERKR